MTTDQPESEEFDEEESAGIDPREVLLFIKSAARKHWRLGLGLALSVSVIAIAAGQLLPKTYSATTRILVTQEALVAQVTGNQNRGANVNPFRGLSELVLRSANLKGIVHDADLAARWDLYRQPLFRLKDAILGGNMSKATPKEQERILSGVLETRLLVQSDDANSIVFEARWSDPSTAAKVAEVAQKRFLADQLNQEQAVTREVIRILEAETKLAASTVGTQLARLEELRRPPPAPTDADTDAKEVATVRRRSTAAPIAAGPAPNPNSMLKLEQVRQSIREVQDPWQRRQTELRLQLADLRASYGPKHPLVLHQESRIRESETPPAELGALHAEEQNLLAEIESFALAPSRESEPTPTATVTTSRTVDRARPRVDAPVFQENSPKLQAEQERLFTAISKYNNISSRLDSAKLEEATTEIAFRYRYIVVLEPEIPDKPLKPKLPLIIGFGGVAFGLLLGLLAGAVKELARGRVLAPFQVKQLGLPVLAEISLRPPPSGP